MSHDLKWLFTVLLLSTHDVYGWQMLLPRTRVAKVVGSSVGVTIGCLLGMAPLLFLETREDQQPVAETAETTKAS